MSDLPASNPASRSTLDRRFTTVDQLASAMSAEFARRRFHEIAERLIAHLRAHEKPLPAASTDL